MMSKRLGLWSAALAVFSFSALAWAADDLPTVEKKIVEAWNKHKSGTCKVDTVTHIETPEYRMDTKSTGTHEYLRRGDKVLSHMVLKSETTSKVGDQETKTDQQVTMVIDGDYAWTLNEMSGQKTATKADADPKMTGEPKAMFEELHKDHELTLLPDETLDGKKVFVIEAAPKQKTAGSKSKMVLYIDQGSGMAVKTVMFDDAGKPMMTATITDVKLDVDINPDQFVFKAPAGVEVQDMTAKKTPGGKKEP
jgi:outer membrane lipoprotein-sorting protein